MQESKPPKPPGLPNNPEILRRSLTVARPAYSARPDAQYDPASISPQGAGISRGEAAIELIVIMAVLFGPGLMRQIISYLQGSEPYSQAGAWIYLMAASTGLLVLLLVWFILHKDGQSLRSIGLHGKKLSAEVGVGIATLMAIYFAMMVVTAVFFVVYLLWPQATESTLNDRYKLIGLFPALRWYFLVPFCVFVGFYEELLFRGFLLDRLKIALGSWPMAIPASALIFALGHLYEGPLAVLQIFIMGLILAAIYVRRGSIVGIALAHAGFNMINLSIMQNFQFFQDFFNQFNSAG